MKNKTLLIISLLMVAFLIGTSYAPQAALAETMQQEGPVDESANGQIDMDSVDPINPMSVRKEAYNLPGMAFIPNDSRIEYIHTGYGCVRTEDFSASVRIIAPINVPNGAKATAMVGMFKNTVDNPSQQIIVLFNRSSITEESGEDLLLVTLSDSEFGFGFERVDVNHVFDTLNYKYQFIVQMPRFGGKMDFCGMQIEYETPGIFGLGLPLVNN